MVGLGGEASSEVRKKVTAVFADLAGSTTLAETLDPELFRQVVRAFFERMARTIERHGGTVENFVGDEVMGVFGVPITHGDDAIRAAHAALEMRGELDALNSEISSRVGTGLALRIGINTGTVVVGPPIGGRAMSLGDTMNIAARLEKLAEPGQIMIGEDTYQLVRDEFDLEPAGRVQLRGRNEPLAAYLLIGAGGSGAEPLADRPLVGRTRELALMQVAFERCVAREQCEFVTLLGEPGVGKSRLVAEMLNRYSSSARVLVGRCLPYGEGITYWPLVEIVWQAAGVEDSDDANAARAKLESVLADDPDGPAVARHLAQMTGLDDGFDPGEQSFWAVRRLLEVLAARRPVVAWLEDVQWAEPTMLDLLAHLARHLRDAPVLLACTARFELLDRRPEWREECPTTIALDPLDGTATAEIVEKLTGGGVGGDLRARIVDLAAGNPLFVEQLLSMLIDEGVLRRSGDGWIAENGGRDLTVPPTVEAVLAARIDHLAPAERALAEGAAVIGKEFWVEAAASLAGDGGAEEVDALVAKRLIEPVRRPGLPRDYFQFRHILVRDAVYGTLSKARRAELHERFSDWLLGWSESRLGQVEEIVGYHLETAHALRRELLALDDRADDIARRAARHLSNAGARAAARQDDAGAAALLARAVAMLAEGGASDPAARLEPLIELGTALVRGGETERAHQVLDEARRSVVAAGDERSKARMWVLEANLKRLTDPVWWTNHGRTAAERALAVFHRHGDDLDAARSWHLLGKVHSDRGQQAAAADALERALELASAADDAGVEAWIRFWLLQVSTLGPVPCERVIARARDDLDWARAHDNRALEGSTLGRMGEMLARTGKLDEAQHAFAEARSLFEELGLSVHVSYLALSTALVEPLAGDPEAAERELRPAIEFFDESGAAHISASLLPLLASALVRKDQIDEALELCERTEEIAAPDDLDAQVRWRIARSQALAAAGRLPEAERFAREAAEVAEPGDTVILCGDALTALGEALLAARSPSEAVPVLERALELYESKGDTVSAGQRRATLDALSGTKFL